MSYQQHGFSETDLSRFREVQRLAYQCTVEISHDLTEGVTEIEACARTALLPLPPPYRGERAPRERSLAQGEALPARAV
jgi:hypothetical protein